MKRTIFIFIACLFIAGITNGQQYPPNCSQFNYDPVTGSTSGCNYPPFPGGAANYTTAFVFSGYCYNTEKPAPHWGNFTWTGATTPVPAIATGQCASYVDGSREYCPPSYYIRPVKAPPGGPPTYNKIYLYLYNGVASVSVGGACTKTNGPTNYFICMAQACAQHTSPVLIDTTGEGFIGNLTGWEDGVVFDFGDGPKKTGWTRKGSGLAFLALPDANGNVAGPQLFGNKTSQPPSDSPDGFKALGVYDQNKDGKIDPSDPVWPLLVGCIDVNHNGIFERNECVPLEQLGVHSISLDEHKSPKVDPWGNELREWVKIGERADHVAYDVWFTICPN